MENKYRIVVENNGKKFELESTDKNWLEKQKSELSKLLNIFEHTKKLEKSLPEPESIHAATKAVDISRLSINEFFRKYCMNLRANPDIAVFFIYYLNWVSKKKEASTSDVRELFIKAKIQKASSINYGDILAKAKKRALLNYIDNLWSLTITGEDFVLNKLQDKNEK